MSLRALPAIGEDHHMQQALAESPQAAQPQAPSLSPVSNPRSVSSNLGPLSSRSTAETPKMLRETSDLLQWRYPEVPSPTDLPIRRRFHSSDIILRGNRANFHDKIWGNGEKSLDEPEPPLDPAEIARLALRRRTCSENFTKSSRVPSSFYYTGASFSDEREGALGLNNNQEEHNFTVERLLQQLSEEVEEGPVDNQQEASYDQSWTGGTGLTHASNYSVESDGQNLEKLRNLQKLYQEGFITVTEYKDRRVQLVDELSEADQTIAKTTDLLSLELPIIYHEPPDFSLLRERGAIKHVFDSEQRKWTSSLIKVKIDTKPFAKGGLRQVFHLQDLSVPPPAERISAGDEDSVMSKCTSYVAKVAINPDENPDTYFKDVEMQAVAAKYAKLYNSYNPPRRVEFLEAWVLQLLPADASDEEHGAENLTLRGTICGVEPFIAGEYHKHNNNFGYVSELERNTPQAFSHFTYEASGQEILVVDIQGVSDHYTDPQIHTRRGKEFGKGNLALRGFERFLESHRCNPICRYLKLPLINPKDETRTVDPKGTIPAQTYMSQPHVVVDKVDSVLCHYYGDSKAFKKYHAKKKREKKKREKHQQAHRRLGHEELWQAQHEDVASSGCGSGGVSAGIEERATAMHQAGNRFAAALIDQQRSCTSIFCDSAPQCTVS